MDAEVAAEGGATGMRDTHWMTLAYVREFGLTLEPFKSGDLADVVHLRGRNYVAGHGPESKWPLQLSPEERRLGRSGMAEHYLNWPLKLAKGSEDSLSVPGPILEQDHYTLREFLEKQGLPPDAIELITVARNPPFTTPLLLLFHSNAQLP